MKIFIAYRHTGATLEELEALLVPVHDALRDANHEPYCTFFDESEFQDKALGPKEIMEHAFKTLDVSDLLFVLQNSDNKSEGMLMEVGYCIAKKIPVFVAASSDLGYTYLPDVASRSITWSNVEDLTRQIRQFNFSQFEQL